MESFQWTDITKENLSEVCALSTTLSENHQKCVASNAYSIAQAHYYPEHAWFKALAIGEKPIGFIMVDINPEDLPMEDLPAVFLWRFMLGSAYQKKGYGKLALDMLVEKCREENKKTLYVSCELTEEGPYDFYIKYGFLDTGKQEDGEQILKLIL